MGRDIDNKRNDHSGGGTSHLSSAIEEIQQAKKQQYRSHSESALQIPVPTAEQIKDTANSAWTNYLEPACKTLNDIREMPPIPQGAFAEYLRGTPEQPRSDESKSHWNDLDMKACIKAYEAFPSLAAHNVSHVLIPALIGNELRHYKPVLDTFQDISVMLTGTVRDRYGSENLGASVGPAQMQLGNIKRLAENYPQLVQFKDNPARAALDPAKAPYFVAAYLDEAIKTLKHEGITPTTDALTYMYNPDLRGHKTADGKQIGPYIQQSRIDGLLTSHHFDSLEKMDYPNSEILNKSKHVKNVREAMRILEQGY